MEAVGLQQRQPLAVLSGPLQQYQAAWHEQHAPADGAENTLPLAVVAAAVGGEQAGEPAAATDQRAVVWQPVQHQYNIPLIDGMDYLCSQAVAVREAAHAVRQADRLPWQHGYQVAVVHRMEIVGCPCAIPFGSTLALADDAAN